MIKKILTSIGLITMICGFSAQAQAYSYAFCNDKAKTSYICVKSGSWGGPLWAIQPPNGSASNTECAKDTGAVFQAQVTVLEDCQEKEGTALTYWP